MAVTNLSADLVLATIANDMLAIKNSIAEIDETQDRGEHAANSIVTSLARIAYASNAALLQVTSPVIVRLTFTWTVRKYNKHESSIVLRRDGSAWKAAEDKIFAGEHTKYGTSTRQQVFKWADRGYRCEFCVDVGTINITHDNVGYAELLPDGGGTLELSNKVVIEYI